METSTVEPPVANESQEVDDVTKNLTVENHIWIYTSPLILVLGVVGNILTIVVKTAKTRVRGSSTRVYFSVLAAGDLLVVVIGLIPEWLGQMGIIELWNINPWVCRVELYLYYTALDFAIWMLVAFTCDRVIAVRFPLHKRRICTARNAGIVSFAIFLAANLNAHVFWTRGAQYNGDELVGNCRWLGEYFYFESTVRPWLVMAFALLGPFVIIGVCNMIILTTVKTARRVRKMSATGSLRNRDTARRMDRYFGQTTVMCMFTSVAFMLLVLPNIVLLIGKKAWSNDNPAYWYARAVAGQLVYINHSINFLLYSLTGSHFRKELLALCKKKEVKKVTEISFANTKTSRSTSMTSQNNIRLNVSLVQDSTEYMRNSPFVTGHKDRKDFPIDNVFFQDFGESLTD